MASSVKMNGKKATMDLTEGNIVRQLLVFAMPILIGQIFQNLYNSVDAVVVGNAVGMTSLAAVSASSDISMLLTGFFTGFSTGAGVLISRFFGAKDQINLHKAIHTSVSFSLLIGVIMAVVGIIFTPAILRLKDCPSDVWDEAVSYLGIYLIGIFFTAIYNVGAGILRAVGDSRRPLYYLIITSITNMILDILFVVLLDLGVRGAALATIISQALSCVMVFGKMIRTDEVYKLQIRDLRMDKKILLEVIRIGLPAGIQSALISISNLFVQRYINGFGSAAMAGIGAAKKVDRFVGMAAQSMGLATATFVGQNYGAKKHQRAFKGIRTSILVCTVYWITAGALVIIFAAPLVRIFTSDETALEFGVSMIRVMMPLYCFQILNNIFANAVRGFGKSLVVMCCSVFGMIGCRQIFLAISMSISWRVENVYVGFPVGWACAAAAVIIYYFIVIKKEFKTETIKA